MDSRRVRPVARGDPIRVVVVGEHPLIRAGLRGVLDGEGDIELLANVASVDEALAGHVAGPPDVVLVDLDLPADELLEELRRLREEYPDSAVVVLSHGDADADLFRAVVAGAAGHVPDVADPAELTRTIRRAARGDEPIRRSIARRPAVGRRVLETLGELSAARQESAQVALSERERSILWHAARGLTNQQIGRRLGLSENTVKATFSGILVRLGVHHRTEAVVRAMREGWIDLDEGP